MCVAGGERQTDRLRDRQTDIKKERERQGDINRETDRDRSWDKWNETSLTQYCYK